MEILSKEPKKKPRDNALNLQSTQSSCHDSQRSQEAIVTSKSHQALYRPVTPILDQIEPHNIPQIPINQSQSQIIPPFYTSTPISKDQVQKNHQSQSPKSFEQIQIQPYHASKHQPATIKAYHAVTSHRLQSAVISFIFSYLKIN